MKIVKLALLTAAAAVVFQGCGKSANLGERDGQNDPTPGSNPTPTPTPTVTPGQGCSASDSLYWSFTQPADTTVSSVDVLFVMDSSASMLDKRGRLARDFPGFVQKLPAGADYRIGVMLAHGGASAYSGSLFAPQGNPAVLNSTTQSQSQIMTELACALGDEPQDEDHGAGEMMMYSFMKSQDAAHVAAIKAQGFYRDNAALSVIFVTDENDICYPPQLHGFDKWPDYVPSVFGAEMIAYKKYCLAADGSVAFTPEKTLASLPALKGTMPVSLGGVIHVDRTKVPHLNTESIGHGIFEMMTAFGSDRGVMMDITNSSFADPLAQLANLSYSQSHLEYDFALADTQALDTTTLAVEVDGVSVPYTYNGGTSSIVLQPGHAGHGGSSVVVTGCKIDLNPVGQ